eukprot:2034-Pyramimonas_sp.AAC.1
MHAQIAPLFSDLNGLGDPIPAGVRMTLYNAMMKGSILQRTFEDYDDEMLLPTMKDCRAAAAM